MGAANDYRKHVAHLAGQWPGLAYLDIYLNDSRYSNEKQAPITLLELDREMDSKPSSSFPSLCSFWRSYFKSKASCRLIIVEDPTPNTIAEIGGELNIDPQFWADFLVGSAWFQSGEIHIGLGTSRTAYRDESLLDQLWPLKSAAMEENHICLRFIVQKEADIPKGHDGKKRNVLSDRYPLPKPSRTYPPTMAEGICTRQNATIWRREQKGRWTGEI